MTTLISGDKITSNRYLKIGEFSVYIFTTALEKVRLWI